jgi:acyl-coenzyme A thioesterase PaaI-like protein
MFAPLLRKMNAVFAPNVVRVFGNFYVPFLGAGIKIAKIDPDFRYIRVEMPLRPFNRNYVGSHFGGSIYAMTDPFYMMMLMQNLGPGYIVWDRAAKIDFLKPGRSRLIVEFRFSEAEIQEVRAKTAGGQKYLFDKEVLIHDDKGELIAKVVKTLYVRKKDLASKA